MAQIQTFVFFDTEATGLLGCDTPKFTELAFVACKRNHLLEAAFKKVPRVIFKLLVPINPSKVIHPDSTRVTGLDNFMLEYINKFDENTVDLINCFFNQLTKPVCLVAHNGNNFDYVLLQKQLHKLNRSFDDDLLCVDSLKIFRKIDENATTNLALEEFLNVDLQAIQNQNEKTPSKRHSNDVSSRIPHEKPSCARELFTSPNDSSTTANSSSSQTAGNSARKSYKLCEIYKRLHDNNQEKAHNAEADTLHLLLCAIAVKEDFVRESDSMATKFSEIKPN